VVAIWDYYEEWCLLGCYAMWLFPEDTILHSHRSENLKSYMGLLWFPSLLRWFILFSWMNLTSVFMHVVFCWFAGTKTALEWIHQIKPDSHFNQQAKEFAMVSI
jgi:hypothetical protein